MKNTLPSIFIGHGAPLEAIQKDQYHRDLHKFSNENPLPKSIISVSAHWEIDIPVEITSNPKPPQIYDFWGFPSDLYEIKYEPQGNPELVNQVVKKFDSINIEIVKNSERGIDHGTWVPLSIMYPQANIPTIQISIPKDMPPEYLMRMGEELSDLRNEGVLFMGSGNIVHNLRLVRGLSPSLKFGRPDTWALEFDEWIKNKLENLEIDKLRDYRRNAPNSMMAVPTTEHFYPLFFTLGTLRKNENVDFITEEMYYQNISMRSIELVS